MREKVLLICEECLSRNYSISMKRDGSKLILQLKKFCAHCGKHTNHKVSK